MGVAVKRSPMPRPDPAKNRAWREGSKPLERKAPIKKENRKRAAKQRERNFGERAAKVRDMHCLTVPLHALGERISCRGRIVAAHAKPRQMGGCGDGDRRMLVNLCEGHHDEAGEFRTSQRAEFEAKWGVDLVAEAAILAERFDAMGLP